MTVLGYGSVLGPDGNLFAAYRRGDEVIDLSRFDRELFASGTLDRMLAAGASTWARIADAVRDADATHALDDVRPHLPFTVTDYVDFYASEHHATNAGRIFRPAADPLPANWKHLPVGYHGRSGSVVVSGTDIVRPAGMLAPGSFGPTQRLDLEAEVAFVVGTPGSRIRVEDADEHVFGICLLNDWSARDIQRFETAPLGPFLGKSFATSIAGWITPLDVLAGARMAPAQDPQPLPHLRETEPPHGLRLDLEIRINDDVVSSPCFADMYWTYAQMLAHLTSNGSSVRTGDVFASGTVSGPSPGQRGCLLELTWNGEQPLVTAGRRRTWLEDGDTVTISAAAGELSLGDVTGRVVAHSGDMEPSAPRNANV